MVRFTFLINPLGTEGGWREEPGQRPMLVRTAKRRGKDRSVRGVASVTILKTDLLEQGWRGGD